MRTILALLTITLAMPAIVGCELSTNVVNCTALALFAEDAVKPQPADTVDIHAKAETEPVTNPCDAADDPAIWGDPDVPENSRIVVSNKTGKLAVHGLDGRTLAEIRVGRINNVDIRGGVTTGGRERVVVAATNRSTETIDVFELDGYGGTLTSLLAEPIRPDFEEEIYGICLYRRAGTGALYAFVNDKAGNVAQWRLDDDGRDGLTGRPVRTWATGVETEGCVVDDANGWLHLGAQNDGIWRYDARPDGGTEPTIVDTTGVEANSGGRLAGDVEGLTLYVGRSGDPDDGYLIASSQGNNTYVVYDRAAPHAYRGTFRVVAHVDVDGTEGNRRPRRHFHAPGPRLPQRHAGRHGRREHDPRRRHRQRELQDGLLAGCRRCPAARLMRATGIEVRVARPWGRIPSRATWSTVDLSPAAPPIAARRRLDGRADTTVWGNVRGRGVEAGSP